MRTKTRNLAGLALAYPVGVNRSTWLRSKSCTNIVDHGSHTREQHQVFVNVARSAALFLHRLLPRKMLDGVYEVSVGEAFSQRCKGINKPFMCPHDARYLTRFPRHLRSHDEFIQFADRGETSVQIVQTNELVVLQRWLNCRGDGPPTRS